MNNMQNNSGGGSAGGDSSKGGDAPPGFYPGMQQRGGYPQQQQQPQQYSSNDQQYRQRMYQDNAQRFDRSGGPPSIVTMNTTCPPHMEEGGGGGSSTTGESMHQYPSGACSPYLQQQQQQYGNQQGPMLSNYGMDRNYAGQHSMLARSHSNFSESSTSTHTMQQQQQQVVGGGAPDPSTLAGAPIHTPMMYQHHEQVQQQPQSQSMYNPQQQQLPPQSLYMYGAPMGGPPQQMIGSANGQPMHQPNMMTMSAPSGPPGSGYPAMGQPIMMIGPPPAGATPQPPPAGYFFNPAMVRGGPIVGQNPEGYVQFQYQHQQQPPPQQQGGVHGGVRGHMMNQQRSMNSPAPSDNTDAQSVGGHTNFAIGMWQPPESTSSTHTPTTTAAHSVGGGPVSGQPMAMMGAGMPSAGFAPMTHPFLQQQLMNQQMSTSYPPGVPPNGGGGAMQPAPFNVQSQRMPMPGGPPIMPGPYPPVYPGHQMQLIASQPGCGPQMVPMPGMGPGMVPMPLPPHGQMQRPPNQPMVTGEYYSNPLGGQGWRGASRGRGGRGGYVNSGGFRGSRPHTRNNSIVSSRDDNTASKPQTPSPDADPDATMLSAALDKSLVVDTSAVGETRRDAQKELLQLAESKAASSPPAEPLPTIQAAELVSSTSATDETVTSSTGGSAPTVTHHTLPPTPRSSGGEGRKELLEMKKQGGGGAANKQVEKSSSIPIDPVNTTTTTTWNEDPKKKKNCAYCIGKGRPQAEIQSHSLRDDEGNCTCPLMKEIGCEKCGAKGAKAHSTYFCKVTEQQQHRAEDDHHEPVDDHSHQQQQHHNKHPIHHGGGTYMNKNRGTYNKQRPRQGGDH